MKYIKVKFFILVVLMVGCKKEAIEPEPTIFAGLHDSTFEFYEHPGNTVIDVEWDVQNLYGSGRDSVDLDMNGSADLFFAVNLFNFDSIHLISSPYPVILPKVHLSSSSEFQFAFYTGAVWQGHGSASSFSYVDRLELNEPIDLLTNWTRSSTMWKAYPNSSFAPPPSDWLSAGSSHFIAIKRGEDKFGWVEIDLTDSYNPIVLGFAIEG